MTGRRAMGGWDQRLSRALQFQPGHVGGRVASAQPILRRGGTLRRPSIGSAYAPAPAAVLATGSATPLYNTAAGSDYTQAATAYAVNTTATDLLASTYPTANILLLLGATWFVDSASAVFDSGTKNAVGYGAGTPSFPGLTHFGTLEWETENSGVVGFASGYTIAGGLWWADLGAITSIDVSDLTGVTACLNQGYVATDGVGLTLLDTHPMGVATVSDALSTDVVALSADGIPKDSTWSAASFGGVPVPQGVYAGNTFEGAYPPFDPQLPIAWLRATIDAA